MKRSWIWSFGILGSLAVSGLCSAQEGSKNEEKPVEVTVEGKKDDDKKEEKKEDGKKDEEKKGETKVTLKTSGKIVIVGPDGKVMEKNFGDFVDDEKTGEGKSSEGKSGEFKVVEGKLSHVTVKGEKGGDAQEIVIVTPDGKKKKIVLNKVDVTEEKSNDGKKTIRIEARTVDDDGERKTIVVGDGKTFDVQGVGVDIEKIKKLIAEKKGDVDPKEIVAILKTVEGKPLGGAIRLQLHKEGDKPHVVVKGTATTTTTTDSSSSDVGGKLDKILERLEKLEERLSALEKKD